MGSNLGTKLEASWPKGELRRAQEASYGKVRSAVHEAHPQLLRGVELGAVGGARSTGPILAHIGGSYQYSASYL